MEPTFLYFAYGSNLLKERLQLHNPSAAVHCVARLQVGLRSRAHTTPHFCRLVVPRCPLCSGVLLSAGLQVNVWERQREGQRQVAWGRGHHAAMFFTGGVGRGVEDEPIRPGVSGQVLHMFYCIYCIYVSIMCCMHNIYTGKFNLRLT